MNYNIYNWIYIKQGGEKLSHIMTTLEVKKNAKGMQPLRVPLLKETPV